MGFEYGYIGISIDYICRYIYTHSYIFLSIYTHKHIHINKLKENEHKKCSKRKHNHDVMKQNLM